MLNVQQILASKAQNAVYSVTPDQTVYDALEMMAAHNTGTVLVMEGERLAGIFSERDYARKGVLKGRSAQTTPVSELMTADVFTVKPQTSLEVCMQMMSENKIRHLPVLDGGRVVGLISISDVVTTVMREQQARIQSLEEFIAS
jgi:CBS domain-containing protein